jgi:glutathione synthase
MDYITSTLYLENIPKKVKILNNPISLRNISEKFYSSNFLKFMPPTIFTKDLRLIKKFYKENKKIVIKPIHGYAGKDILFIDRNFNKNIIKRYIKKIGHVMVQKFLPLVKHGDKRVFILNGKVKGAIRRVPSKGSILSNISQGGSALKTKLNKKELYISKVIAKKLKKNNIFFAGIDLISNYLIGDINVTSPTGLPQYKNLTGINLAKNYWDEVKKLK